ncbi:MAG: hypothetical protein ACI4IW_01370 [Oscillospiraceae bacterium]
MVEYLKNSNINNETIFVIGEFALMWREFENHFFSQQIKAYKIPRKAKEIWKKLNIEEKIRVERKCITLQKNIIKYVFENQKINLDEVDTIYLKNLFYPLFYDFTDNDLNSISVFLKYREDVKQFDCEECEGCLITLYRLRNSLLHGKKLLAL